MTRVIKGLKKGDTVQLISGANKGTTGAIVAVDTKARTVQIEGIGVRHRHVKPSQLNPRGGSKDIHESIPVSKVKKVEAPKKAVKKATKETK